MTEVYKIQKNEYYNQFKVTCTFEEIFLPPNKRANRNKTLTCYIKKEKP